MSSNTDNWTKITPEQFEAIGFVDTYFEDENGKNVSGEVAVWSHHNLPPHVEILSANYLASVWQIFSCSEEFGDEFFDIRTESEFNEIMKHLNLDLRL